PRPLPALTALLEESQTVMTHAPTAANAANLAAGFVETLSRAYAGQLARQELGGEIIDEA
ncbi:MAG TPA: ATP-binding protein, partial [Hyphomonadaceae bacterium]|nr:ATP-binding protein [Hyphomonadaceae bacterium]